MLELQSELSEGRNLPWIAVRVRRRPRSRFPQDAAARSGAETDLRAFQCWTADQPEESLKALAAPDPARRGADEAVRHP